MTFEVIEYNKHFIIRRVLLYSVFILLISIIIIEKTIGTVHILNFLLPFITIILLINNLAFKAYNNIGEILISNSEIVTVVSSKRMILRINDLKKIVLIYEGYDKETCVSDLLRTGLTFKDGSNNYLIFINDQAEHKIHIYIKNKKSVNKLISYIKTFKEYGITCEVDDQYISRLGNVLES